MQAILSNLLTASVALLVFVLMAAFGFSPLQIGCTTIVVSANVRLACVVFDFIVSSDGDECDE